MFFFLLFGRGRGPRPKSKKKHAPAQTAINKHAPAPSEHVLLLLGRVGVFFLLFGRVAFLFVFAVCAGACCFFCCLGADVFLFSAVWAGCVFLLFGRSAYFCFCCLGAGRKFTHLPATKETKQQKKKKTGSEPYPKPYN